MQKSFIIITVNIRATGFARNSYLRLPCLLFLGKNTSHRCLWIWKPSIICVTGLRNMKQSRKSDTTWAHQHHVPWMCLKYDIKPTSKGDHYDKLGGFCWFFFFYSNLSWNYSFELHWEKNNSLSTTTITVVFGREIFQLVCADQWGLYAPEC